jgi:hypothetical protein
LKEQQDFAPENIVFNPGGRNIDHFLMGFPQDKQKGSWRIMLDSGLNRLAKIYFSLQDAKTFSDKVNESLAGLK